MGLHAAIPNALRILIVDRDDADRAALRRGLEARVRRPLAIHEAADCAVDLPAGRPFDVLAVDLATSGGSGAVADLIARSGARTTFALGPSSAVREAVAAVRAGAEDYIEKPLDADAAALRIDSHVAADAAAGASSTFEGMTGRSPAMQALFRTIERVAPAHGPVLVLAAPGAGSTSVAEALHRRSRRRAGPFVEVRCGAPDGPADGEVLFAEGGAFDRADGGSLHLADVHRLGRTSLSVLAGYLDGGEIGAAGARRRPSVRVLASTTGEAALARMPAAIRFRLAALPVRVPPLSERGEDLAPMLEGLLRSRARAGGLRPVRLAPDVPARLATMRFPRNCHDLAALADRLASLAAGGRVDAALIDGVTASADRRPSLPSAMIGRGY
jgi:DNA-binding NtrC family response regulator